MVVLLSKNEKFVLTKLIENARLSDVDIAKELGISSQAVHKIRRKLEQTKIIEKYTLKVNFEAIGVNSFAVAMIENKPKFWEEIGEAGAREGIKNAPSIMFCCRTPEVNTPYIALHGFRDQNAMDSYFRSVQTSLAEYGGVRRMYSFPVGSLLKFDASQIVIATLEGRQILPLMKRKAESNDFFGMKN